ncbi:tetratricopeptide repeat protein [Litoreibacter albidus]|uniref:tetratricopeptide repeat protein n=1 Tax=Litoreibacter albidus TaxID=670155 RepID=UPI0037364D0F
MLRSLAFVAGFALPNLALALDCPSKQDNPDVMDRLHSELLTSQTEMAARTLNDAIWEHWLAAPDEMSQDLLDRGRERIRVADYERAIEHFTNLIEYCQLYAEGWNQRAYVYFLRADFSASLEGIAKVLEINPRHFGALAGRSSVLVNMRRTTVGSTALREASKINPWLSERHLLPLDQDI